MQYVLKTLAFNGQLSYHLYRDLWIVWFRDWSLKQAIKTYKDACYFCHLISYLKI